MKHEKIVPYLICRRLGRSTVKVIFFIPLLFALGLMFYDCKEKKQQQTLKKSRGLLWGSSARWHVGLSVFRWCCSVIALLLLPHKRTLGKHISNTSEWRQPHGNLCICYYCIHRMRCSGQCNYAKSSQLPSPPETLSRSAFHGVHAGRRKKYIYFCKYHLHIPSAPFDHGCSTPDEGWWMSSLCVNVSPPWKIEVQLWLETVK